MDRWTGLLTSTTVKSSQVKATSTDPHSWRQHNGWGTIHFYTVMQWHKTGKVDSFIEYRISLTFHHNYPNVRYFYFYNTMDNKSKWEGQISHSNASGNNQVINSRIRNRNISHFLRPQKKITKFEQSNNNVHFTMDMFFVSLIHLFWSAFDILYSCQTGNWHH